MPSSTRSTGSTLTDAQTVALAKKILAERANGTPYDGPNGLLVRPGFEACRKSAIVARGILRKAETLKKGTVPQNAIRKSYVRTDEFKAQESARRSAKAEPAPVAKKTAAKAAPKRTRKPAAKKA